MQQYQPQQWLAARCSDFINNNAWPPNSPDLNPLDYHVWGWMLEKYKCLNPQPKNISELKTPLLKVWDELPQDAVKKHQLSQASALASTLVADTLNIHCKGLPFKQ